MIFIRLNSSFLNSLLLFYIRVGSTLLVHTIETIVQHHILRLTYSVVYYRGERPALTCSVCRRLGSNSLIQVCRNIQVHRIGLLTCPYIPAGCLRLSCFVGNGSLHSDAQCMLVVIRFQFDRNHEVAFTINHNRISRLRIFGKVPHTPAIARNAVRKRYVLHGGTAERLNMSFQFYLVAYAVSLLHWLESNLEGRTLVLLHPYLLMALTIAGTDAETAVQGSSRQHERGIERAKVVGAYISGTQFLTVHIVQRQVVGLALHYICFLTFLTIHNTFHIHRLPGAINTPVGQQCHVGFCIHLMFVRPVTQIHALPQHRAVIALTRHIGGIAVVGAFEHLTAIGTRCHFVVFLIVRVSPTIKSYFHATNGLTRLTVERQHLGIAIAQVQYQHLEAAHHQIAVASQLRMGCWRYAQQIHAWLLGSLHLECVGMLQILIVLS